jgi:hypothetical protein
MHTTILAYHATIVDQLEPTTHDIAPTIAGSMEAMAATNEEEDDDDE